jgi:hypothetical protein
LIKKNVFNDVVIYAEAKEEGLLIPLRLRINEEGITFSAELIQGQEPNLEALELLLVLDDVLHKLGIPERPGQDIKKSHKIIISF